MSGSSRTPSETKPNPKDAHLSELTAELARWQQEKDQLVARAAATSGRARAELEEDLRELDRGFEDARSALTEAEKSPAKRWVQAKARVDDAFQALRDKVHELKSP